eukprot:m.111669 g.111669  ORF g.111669 m.111669 type:complete len:355 (+) comp10758_c0_seq2:142-1206(+)
MWLTLLWWCRCQIGRLVCVCPILKSLNSPTDGTKTAQTTGEPFSKDTTERSQPLPMTSAPTSAPDTLGDMRVPQSNNSVIDHSNLRLSDIVDIDDFCGTDGDVEPTSPDSTFIGLRVYLDQLPPQQSIHHQYGLAQVDFAPLSSGSDQQLFHFDGTEYPPPPPMSPVEPSMPLMVPGATPPASTESHGSSTAHRRLRSGTSVRKMLKFGGQAGKSQREAKPKHKINPSPPKATEAEQVQMDAWKEQCGDELMVIPMAEWQEEMQRLYAPATPRDWELLVLLRKQANNRKYQAVHKQKKMLDYHHLQADIQALSAQCAALGVENEKIKAAKAEVVADNRKLIQMILDLKEQLCNQ